jgi:O-antigen ligase
MFTRIHSIYLAAELKAKISILALVLTLLLALVAVAFGSPSLVVGVVMAVLVTVITFLRPTWSLGFLATYLPFEPFVLKWLPDELYVYAKYGSELLIYLLVAVIIWRLLSGEINLKRTPADIPFILLVFALLAATVINFLPITTAVLGARQILRFILLFFVTVYLAPSKDWIRKILMILAAVLLIQIILGAAQAVFGAPVDTFLLPSERRSLGDIQLTTGTTQFWDSGQRVFGTLGRYDQLGTFMAFVMLMIIAALYERIESLGSRLWLWALLFLSLPILALTYSRASWFGFLLGLLFIGMWVKRDKRVMAAAILLPSLLLVYLGVTGLVVRNLVDVPSQSLAERFFEAFSRERWEGEYFGLGRLYWMVQTAVVVVPASPIFGHGPGTYGGGAAAALGNTEVYDDLSLPFGVYGSEGYIDNNWFSLWGEVGSLGLIIYLWLFLGLLFACLHVYKSSQDKETKALALGVCAAMLALAFNAGLGTYLEVRTIAPYIWLLAGAVVVLGQRERVL